MTHTTDTADTAGTPHPTSTTSTTGTAATAEDLTAAGPAAGPEGAIAANRHRIDDLDARILALVQERMAVSAEIQRTRIGSGGRRISLAREMEVLTHYSERLGRPGTALAMTLLELCRGKV
jgi:chorismate mutase